MGMESRPVNYSLGPLSSISAETFGEPGRRTFRLILKAGAANISVWLEKEQLFQLGASLQEAVRRLSSEQQAGTGGLQLWAKAQTRTAAPRNDLWEVSMITPCS